jgi:predicted transcriptional regulator
MGYLSTVEKQHSDIRDVDSDVAPSVPAARAGKRAAPKAWLDALEESEKDLAAGRTVSSAEVMQHLHEGIARLEAKRAARRRR